MPLFTRREVPPGAPPLTAADLLGLHESLDRLLKEIASVREAMSAHGRAIEGLPTAIPPALLAHLENEASALATKLAYAAFRKAREELFSGAVKWGVRAAITGAGGAVVSWWFSVLGGLHK